MLKRLGGSNKRMIVFVIAIIILFGVLPHQSAGADTADTVDDNPITDLKIVKTTNKDNVPPSCGTDWNRIDTDLQAGGLVVGGGDFSEPAFYLCYKTGHPNNAITHLYPISISSTGGIGRNGCYGNDKKVEDKDGKSDVNRGGWKEQEDRLCYGTDGANPLLGIKIKTYLSDINNYVYRKPNVNPKTDNGATGQTFNFGGTLLYVYTRDRSTTEDDFTYNCGGEGEDACDVTTEFWWTNGNFACDRGLREKDGQCVNGLAAFKRHSDAVDDFMGGVDNGDWVLWALDNQRTNLAIDEPLNWVMKFATHNAFNNYADGYIVDPNHSYSISDQLDLGSRRIMLDVHDYNGEIRLCHGQSDGTGCLLTDRLYFGAIKEIGVWLDNNPGEFVHVHFEEYLSPSDAEAINVPIEKYIGSYRIYRHEEYATVLTECLNGTNGCTASVGHRWPTLGELRAAGKQAMFTANQNSTDFGTDFFTQKVHDDEIGGKANDFFGGSDQIDEYSVSPYPDDLSSQENCISTPVWATTGLTVSQVGEDRTVSGLFVSSWPGVLNADRVKTLARCNFTINFDFINAQQNTPTGLGTPCLKALADGLVDPCIAPDNRLEAAVWSWGSGDMGQFGDYAFLDDSDKRWGSWNGDEEYHFACGKPRDEDNPNNLADLEGADWKVTEAVGPWEEGGPACDAEFGNSGYVFSVPVNGWQNEKLKDALKDAKNESGYDDSSDNVWLNYRKGKDPDGNEKWVKGRDIDAAITVVQPAFEGTPGVFYNSGRSFGFNSNGIVHYNHKWELKDIAAGTTSTLADGAPGFFPIVHTFQDDGSYEIILTVTDPVGQTGIDRVTFKVKNFQPFADFTGSSSVLENNDGMVEFKNQDDLGPDDLVSGFTYSYDFDSDGTWELSDVISPTVTVPASFLVNGPLVQDITGRIKDKDGGFRDYIYGITIDNVPPSADFNATTTSAAPAARVRKGADLLNNVPAALTNNLGQISFNEGTGANLLTNPVDAPEDLLTGLRVVYFGQARGQQVTSNPDPGLTGTLTFDCQGYTNPLPGSRPPFAYFANGVPFGQSSCNFLDGPGQQQVSAWLIDDDDDYTEYNGLVTILNVAPTVQTPQVSVTNPDEGSIVKVSADFSDPGVQDGPFTCTVNYGDGSGDQAGTVVITDSLLQISGTCTGPDHVYADNGSYTISVSIADKDHSATVNGQGSSSTSVTVLNVDPTLSLSANPVNENGIATVNGTINDPGTLDTFKVEIDWGEGNPLTYSYGAGTTSFSETHQYLDDDPTGTPSDIYTITGKITDDDNGPGNGSTTVKVSNVNPDAQIDSLTNELGETVGSGLLSVPVHTEMSLTSIFSDVGTKDTHGAVINWDDGSGDINLGSTTGTTSASHIYAAPGDYTIVLQISDDDTGADQVMAAIKVVGSEAAVEDLAGQLAGVNADPAVADLINEAIAHLIGDAGGEDNNGASDALAKGNVNAAFVKMGQAMESLEDAEGADAGLDLTSEKNQLALIAKSTALTAVLQAQAAADKPNDHKKVDEAFALIDEANTLLAGEKYIEAVGTYREAAQKVQGIVK